MNAGVMCEEVVFDVRRECGYKLALFRPNHRQHSRYAGDGRHVAYWSECTPLFHRHARAPHNVRHRRTTEFDAFGNAYVAEGRLDVHVPWRGVYQRHAAERTARRRQILLHKLVHAYGSEKTLEQRHFDPENHVESGTSNR